MTRVGVVLWLAVLASAMAVVHTQYASRKGFMALEQANKEAAHLEQEQERLRVERRDLSAPTRVDRMARQQLGMRVVSPGITEYVAAPATRRLP